MNKFILIVAVVMLSIVGCEEYGNAPFVDSGNTPGPISNIEVENLPGGAKITYSLPDDPEVLYVEAVYNTKGKGNQVVKSSVYKNHLYLDGFFDSGERIVKLYIVNRSQNKSDPIEVIVNPLEAPIHAVFRSLKVNEDFGGVNIKLHNETGNEYVIYTLLKDSVGQWNTYDRRYTGMEEINYSVHGLPAEELEFAFLVRDEWQNYSDTVFKTLTPIFEEELDKSLWRAHPLDNDAYKPLYSNRDPDLMWDGVYTTSPYTTDPVQVTLSQWVTIDL